MKYLSIALYHPSVLPGGAQYAAKDLFDAALKDGVDAYLLAAIDANEFHIHSKVGAAITSIGSSGREYLLLTKGFNSFYHYSYDKRQNKAVRDLLRRLQPDVIHLHHSLFIGLEIIDIIRDELPKTKILYTLHEYMPICYSNGQLYRYHEKSICKNYSPDQCIKCFPHIDEDQFHLRRRVFKEAFSKVDAFISPSQYLANVFMDWGLERSSIHVIPNGNNESRKQNLKPSPEKNIFGFFGQYVDAKGIDILIDAVSIAAESISSEIEIHVYGGNKQYATPAYKERIGELIASLPANVTFREFGKYSRDAVHDLMSGVDWVVVPSIWPETFGLVVSEAFDAGRPVIASDIGGLGERIVDGVNGLKSIPGSSISLSRVIKKCLSVEPLWEELNKNIQKDADVMTRWREIAAVVNGI